MSKPLDFPFPLEPDALIPLSRDEMSKPDPEPPLEPLEPRNPFRKELTLKFPEPPLLPI